MQIAFTGDVMLGRVVNKVLCKGKFAYVWGDTLDIIRTANLSLINLECVISSIGKQWNRTFKMFHFRAHPNAINVLKAADIDYVSLANNHVLDYETEALLDMLDLLDKNEIKHSGAGRNLKEAMKPAILTIKESGSKSDNDESRSCNSSRDNSIRIGIVSLTDNEPEWGATKSSAGINYIPINLRKRESQEKEEKEVQKIDNNNNYHYYDRLKHSIQKAKEASDIVIVSSHVGPHFRENPSPDYVNFAHRIIDMGADIYWGHSNHMPQGIEIYKENKIIMYDCGDFIDDYAVDPMYRNDLSFIFLLNLVYSDDDDGDDDSNNHEDNGYGVINHDSSENKRSKSGNDSNYYSNNYYFSTEKNDDGINTNHHSKYIIKDIELIPTKIYDFKVNTLLDNESDIAIRRMIKRCSYHGTKCIVTDKGDKKKRVIKIPIL